MFEVHKAKEDIVVILNVVSASLGARYGVYEEFEIVDDDGNDLAHVESDLSQNEPPKQPRRRKQHPKYLV